MTRNILNIKNLILGRVPTSVYVAIECEMLEMEIFHKDEMDKQSISVANYVANS